MFELIFRKIEEFNKEIDFEFSCKNKIDYKSMERAVEAAEKMNLKKKSSGSNKILEAYQCRINKAHFHIGGALK